MTVGTIDLLNAGGRACAKSGRSTLLAAIMTAVAPVQVRFCAAK
jgi:hypothetical protein